MQTRKLTRSESDRIDRLVKVANRKAEGDSNDSHIAALADALDAALDLIGHTGERAFG